MRPRTAGLLHAGIVGSISQPLSTLR
jgi:hypothetical protein